MRHTDHILLIEDDEVDTMTVRRALKDLGTKNPLDCVTNGEEGLDYLYDSSNARPQLILLDINMPRMNGIEFLERMKADPKISAIPVVVLTTSKEEIDRLATFGKNVAGYMVKPVDYPQFVEIMRKITNYWLTSEESISR